MSDPPPSPLAERPAGHSSPARLIALIVLAVSLIGGAVLLGGWLWELGRGGQPLEVQPADRRVLLRASDLVALEPRLLVRTDAETVSKSRGRDGRLELAYRYEHPDPDLPLTIVCQVIVLPTVELAESAFFQLEAANVRSLDQLNPRLSFVPSRDAYHWGDHSAFGLITQAGQPAGLLLTARQDRHVVTVRITGLALDAGQAASLLEPFLESVVKYEP